MKKIGWPTVGTIALGEAGAILKSPGFIMAALAPFALVVIAIAAFFYLQSQDPRVALTIESDDPAIAEAIVAQLSKTIGPLADKHQLRDAQAGHWHPIIKSPNTKSTLVLDGTAIDIGAQMSFDSVSGHLTINLNRPAPPYLIDLIRADTYHVVYGEMNGHDIKTSVITPQNKNGPVETLDTQLIWLLTVLMATASGALAAASTHALTTAFLDRPSAPSQNDCHAREDFLGKLIGIGSAYATLALPWGIVLACAVGALTLTGNPDLVEAVKQVGVSGFDPLRLILFVLCAPAGYVLFGSIALMFAMHSKTAAAARSFTGPMSFLAIAPAPIALAFSANMEGGVFTALSWFPLTATASIQLGFGELNSLDLLIRALFLCFAALAALQFGLRRRARLHVS